MPTNAPIPVLHLPVDIFTGRLPAGRRYKGCVENRFDSL